MLVVFFARVSVDPRKCSEVDEVVTAVDKIRRLVAEGLESLGGLVGDLGVLLGVGGLSQGDLLALVVGGALGLSSVLESVW